MSKIRIIYLYSVCLITLFMAVGGFISSVNYIAQCSFPTSYYASTYYYGDKYVETEYDYKYDAFYQKSERENEKIRNLKSSINSFALLIISAPIFAYHWRKIESERKESEV